MSFFVKFGRIRFQTRSHAQQMKNVALKFPCRPGTKYWRFRRKESVVLAIRNGIISREIAYEFLCFLQKIWPPGEADLDSGGHGALVNKVRLVARRRKPDWEGPRENVPDLADCSVFEPNCY